MRDPFDPVTRPVGDDAKPKSFQVIQCSACPREDRLSVNNRRLEAAHVAGSFSAKGWLVGDKGKHLCASCWKMRRDVRRLAHDETRAKSQQKEAPMAERSPAAQAKIPELYLILGEAYDAAAKTYKKGWSDERIAQDTGFSIEFVKMRREQDFGPVVVDTLARDLTAALGALETDATKLGDYAAGIVARMDTLTSSVATVARLAHQALERLEAQG